MLPPVRATSSFVDYQTPSQQPLVRQRINAANGATGTETIALSPLSGGRLDILSLSAQLRLAQSFSIFSETIGKLIKLPRREGEALADYAQRLSEAVKAMNPAERAALERTLNQLVKGVSLRLLAEILNDPAGPDAARFAMRMEAALLLDRDLAAKAVVSSYRQNGGAEQLPAPPPRPATAAPMPPAGPAGNGTQPAAKMEAETAPPAGEPGAMAAPSHTGGDPHLASTTDTGQPATSAGEASAGLDAEANTTAEHAAPHAGAEIEAEETALPTENGRKRGLSAAATVLEQEIAGELAEHERPERIGILTKEARDNPVSARRSEGGAQENAHPVPSARQVPPTVLHDGPTLGARLPQRGTDQQAASNMSRAAANGEKMAVGVMTALLAEAFAEGGGELLETLPATARLLAERQVLHELPDSELPPEIARQVAEEPTGSIPRSSPQKTAEPEPTSSTRPAGATANPGDRLPGTTETNEQFAVPVPLPPVLREGVPLPYVAYPPEERERDPEERKTKAVSATDEDGERQHSADQQAFGEDQASGDEKEDADAQASNDEAEDEGRANDLYWRMAGWA